MGHTLDRFGTRDLLLPGTIVGRYRVLTLLGRGGMGAVYRAMDLELRREVALKVLAARRTVGAAGARFEREARAAARLDHPGCVRVIDTGRTVDGARWLAMERLGGPTLAAELAEHERFAPRHAVALAQELLAALAHAHRAGILHCDVKPGNAMFTERDGVRRLVLIDFGLARALDEEMLTLPGTILGSPSYVAPERLAGLRFDGRADLYAVGIVLYELLAGVRPFLGKTPEEIALAHFGEPPKPLRAHRPDVRPALAQVIERAMQRDPDSRFASADDMIAALDETVAAERRSAERRQVAVAPPVAPPSPTVTLRAAAATRADETAWTALEIEVAPRPWYRRLWARLRYGDWRWGGADWSAG